jgi:hypothetical protein
VIVDPFNPNVILFALLNTTDARLLLVVPALKFTGEGAPAGAAAVITDPFNPNVIPPALSNVTALRLLLVVPADILKLVRLDATLAVKVPAFNPKETLLPFENEI